MSSEARAASEAEALRKRKRDKDEREDRTTKKKRKAKSKAPFVQTSEDVRREGRTQDEAREAPGRADAEKKELQLSRRRPSFEEEPEGRQRLLASSAPTRGTTASWTVSRPIGGRILDIDPIFSVDEDFLIVVYNTSIQVHSTADSLLVRRIPLALRDAEDQSRHGGVHIVSAALSRVSQDHIWVACSDGRIWDIDWTTGAGAESPFALPAKKIIDVAVDRIQIGKSSEDVLFVLDKTSHSGGQVTLYDRAALTAGSGTLVHTSDDHPHMVRSAGNASVVLVATRNAVHVGLVRQRGRDLKAPGDARYQFFSLDVEDQVATLDLRVPGPAEGTSAAQSTVDFVVGCARGAILVYSDVLSKLASKAPTTPRKGPVQPRTLHWHARAVHAVKWSRDGHYLLSGGSEGVLVLWQLDTGKKDFLPHLSASIENIVVSPRGASYAVHLDDNSVMVLSTAEMKPTAYVSGIQSIVFGERRSKDALVRRVWQEPRELATCVPASVHPLHPSWILLATGEGQTSTLTDGASLSAPYLQVYDLETAQSVAKQAVARTSPADAKWAGQGLPVREPTVTQVVFSHDGRWLATVDEWQPAERDLEPVADGAHPAPEMCRERREVYLKFWHVDAAGGSAFQLASRINDAHHTSRAEAIFGLASDPSFAQFATVGGDGVVRLWAPQRRRRADGVAAAGPQGEELWRWSCVRSVDLARPTGDRDQEAIGLRPAGGGSSSSRLSGALDFSEDGSTLFVAYGGTSGGAVVYVIDAQSGEIRDRIGGLCQGDVKALRSVASCLVLLSDDLKVYNVVSDELHYGVGLKKRFRAPAPLVQLAANRRSQSFALAVPLLATNADRVGRGTASELAVFSIYDNRPQLVRTFPSLITSLLPARQTSGFLVVDAAAQVWSASLSTESNILAQPLADLRLDKEGVAHDEGTTVVQVDGRDEGDGEAASDEEMNDADQEGGDGGGGDEQEDYDVHPAIVPPQRLAEIFNAGPPFAMPPIEDVFYQVANLVAPKPLTSGAS